MQIFDLPYASLSPAQMLDLYLPDREGGPLPLVIWIHGGAFRMGHRRLACAGRAV